MSASAYPQIRDFLKKCSLLEYYDRFISEGFDQLQSLLDVTEADLVAMDVKRGHRRRLQREIATMKGIPSNVPLPIFVQRGSGLEDSNDGHSLNINVPQKILYINNGPPSSNGGSFQSADRSARVDDPPDPPDPPDNGSTKRKYKRHPKRDKNAPVKPLSAYVMFAHKVREEYNGRNISFPDMAKIVGDRWKNIPPEEKEFYETNAAKKKEDYQAKMAVYKTTEHWRKYQEYLKEFKEKYESNSRDQSKPRKRFKNDNSPDSDNPRSDYSSTRSTSVGYENGSGNSSSGSSNGNSNASRHNAQHQFSTGPYFNQGYSNYSPNPANYIPPYPHINPTVYGYTSEQNIGSSLLTPPPSIINTSTGNSAPSTSLADLYAKDDSSAGDDQSQQESSGNGNGSSFGGMGSIGSRSAEGQNSEDSSDSNACSNYTNDTNDTPIDVTLEIDDNSQSQQQSSQHQHQHQHQDSQDNSASSCKQKDAKD